MKDMKGMNMKGGKKAPPFGKGGGKSKGGAPMPAGKRNKGC